MKGGWPNNFVQGMAAGGLAALLIGLLMGAVHNDRPILTVPVPEPAEEPALASLPSSGVAPHSSSGTGRYQIATWEAGGGYGAFILDTSTGTTKVAYSSIKGPNGKNVNNLGKSFSQM